MKLTKLLTGILAGAAISAYADASTATPKKVGPVSYYGALHTSGSKIIGAKNNQQVMLRGVSLFWSDATGLSYYNPAVISWAVDNLKIDMFRYAMGIEYYDSNGGTKNKLDDQVSYAKSPEGQLSTIDRMVQAAIENDVYIIIDWHSHRAHLETSLAATFFQYISTKYKDVPNIIYEIYNEPVSGSGGSWDAIKTYANQVVPAIRANTQNLIIVGTPNWSQHPEQGAQSPISSTNIAYVLHFYAGTGAHSKSALGGHVTSALSAGYPVFISEWGSTNADGDGEPNSSATSEWTSFMDQNMIPNCNWSLRQQTSDVDQKSEKSAIFAGDKSLITAAALDAAISSGSTEETKESLAKLFKIAWAQYDSLELETEIGEVSFKLDSVTVSVVERKLRATWSPELAQDVSAFHNIDAEAELTAILSEQIAAEIDREILRDLRKGAPWQARWDVNGWRRMAAFSTNYTQKDWNQELMTKINQISAQIHKSTLRGGANFIVVSSEISALFDNLEYFHVSDASAESDQYNMGIEKIGSLSGRYQVYRDPYSPHWSIIIGHKGKSLLDTGYIYAPYVPMQLTPTMYNPFNFAPVKGIMTRYAKKMVNNRYYGHVRVDGLVHWSINEFR